MNIKFSEFLDLVNKCYGLSNEKLEEIRTFYSNITANPERFNEFLKSELEWTVMDFKSLINLSNGDLATLLVNHYFDFYYNYFDFEEDYQSSFEISNYINHYTKKSFGFSDQEMMENAYEIVNSIESQSNYAVINLGYDAIHLVIVEKSDKEKILALAKELDIWQ